MPCAERKQRLLRRRFSFGTPHSTFRTLQFRSAFTLIELMVAVGLMAVLLTMIATIFLQATQAFRVARATVEIHRNASAVLSVMENDLTASEFTPYGTGLQGYFTVVAPYTDPNTGNPSPFAALTFTTNAPQPGAANAAPEAVLQLALVRYDLEWDGGNATVQGTRTPRPTYRLMKRVAFPNTAPAGLNLDNFDWTQVQPEPVAFSVLSMHVRLFDTFLQTGLPSGPPIQWTGDNAAVIGNAPPTVRTNPGPPALVEITLELTDQRATRSFTFTQRFYIPASER